MLENATFEGLPENCPGQRWSPNIPARPRKIQTIQNHSRIVFVEHHFVLDTLLAKECS